MGKKHFVAKNVRKRKIYFSLLLACVLMIGLGYANLVSNLSINGTLGIDRYDHTLYGVLRKAAKKGTYARKYTGAHQDSMAGDGDQDIYYWYANSEANGTAIQDKNNVIFAGHCWQMIRTTDTGGVKMIYNGEVENNQCLNTRGNHVGYATRTTQSMDTTYYYGTDYEYDSTNNVFSLSGTVTTGEIKTGQYTCKSTSDTGTCATLYYIDNLSNGTTYNVIPLNSNSHYSQFGTLQFNKYYNSPSYAGYMYNTSYAFQTKSPLTETMLSSNTISTSYWYAHNVVWGSPTANVYNLVNPYKISDASDYPNLVGEYSFRNYSQTYTNIRVLYITAVNGSNLYYIELSDSGNHSLSDFDYTYTYGDSYVDNGNGTYTVTNSDNSNPTTIYRRNWYTDYSSLESGKYVCKNAVNNTCSELWLSRSTSNTSLSYIKVVDVMYANSFEYKLDTEDGTYKYFLSSDNDIFWNYADSTKQASLSTHHYTCFNEIGKCSTLSYVYYINGYSIYYIDLENGKSIEDALNEMLYNDNVNTINSTIKTGIDAWYKKYLSNYDSYIEDTIFCGNRSLINSDSNGWNPNGGGVSENLIFNNVGNDLSCTNETDQFSILNAKARLTYKVGLISSSEANLLMHTIIATGQYYWLISPHSFFRYLVSIKSVQQSGLSYNEYVDRSYGVRPAISLKPGIEYISGDGSRANPYVVDATPIEPESFATDSWITIATAVRNGNTSVYHVGDTREIDLGSLGTHTLRIANMSTPSECSGTDFSQTACGFVIEFADIITKHNMNPNGTYNGVSYQYGWNVGGWPETSMRNYVNNTIYNALPADLKSLIINTKVISSHGSTSGETNFTSTDKLYLLSTHEVWEDENNQISRFDSAYSNTRQLDYYGELGVTLYSNPSGAIKKYNGSADQWWLRTAWTNNSYFYYVYPDGTATNNGAFSNNGVSPAFRIG